MATITGEKNIQLFQMNVQHKALKLELLGMKRRGPSAYSIVKQQYGLKGSKQKVFDQLGQLIEQAKAEA